MSKKGTKKGSSQRKASELGPWVKDCKTKLINDKDFKCTVSIVVESKSFYRQLAEEFDKFCHYGYRPSIKCISVDLITHVLFTQSSKNGESTPFAILCDEILTHTGKYFKGNIPLTLYKYLIKYIILDLKEKRLTEMKKNALNELEYQNKLKKYLGTAGVPNTKSSKTESTKGGKDANKNILNQNIKTNTDLHMRNENIRCLEAIKDEPEGGPNLYVILIQSKNSELPYELLKLDIPVTSLIQLGHLDKVYFDDENSLVTNLMENKMKNTKIEKSLKESYLDKSTCDKSFIHENDIRTFWITNLYYMNRKMHSNYFKNVDTLKCVPEIPDNPKSPDFIEKLRRVVYDSITSTAFESVILRNMHRKHLKEKQIDIKISSMVKLNELEHYNNVLDLIPLDVSSVAIVLDTLISQVCVDMKSEIGYDTDNYAFLKRKYEKPKVSPCKNKSCLNKLIEQLQHNNRFSDINISAIRNLQEPCDNDKCQIKTFYCRDKIMEQSMNLEDDLKEFINSRGTHIKKLFWNFLALSKLERLEFRADLFKEFSNQICDNKLKNEIFDVLICILNSSKEDNITENIIICNDFSSKNETYEDYINRIIEKMSTKMIKSFPDKYSILELLPPTAMFQNLKEALMYSSNYKVNQIAINDKFVITFYDLKAAIKTTVELPTLLPLREFIDEIIIEQKSEIKGLFNNRKRFNYLDMLYEKFQSLPVTNFYAVTDIICDSTKYHGNTEDWLELSFDTDYEKKCRYKYFMEKGKNEEKKNNTEYKKPIFYDMGMIERMKFDFFEISVKLNKNLEIFLKYMEANYQEKYDLIILTKIRNHEIRFMTNILPEDFVLETTDKRNSEFFICHSSGIFFSIRKISNVNDNIQIGDFPKLNYMKFDTNVDLPETNIFESDSKYHFELNISWPNGLTIQQINKPGLPLYIKQKYILKPNININDTKSESYRCVLSSGVVIKFMENGNMIFLYGNGKVITCTDLKGNHTPDSLNTNPEIKNTQRDFLNILMFEERTSDGKIYLYNDNIKTDYKQLFVEDIHNILEGNIKTEFSDGINYEHRNDGSLYITFLDGTTITSFAKFADKEFLLDTSNIFIENSETNSYVIIESAYEIDHPCYASVIFNFDRTASIIPMPDNIYVTLSQDININFNDELQIKNDRSTLVIKEKKNNQIQNSLVFSFENFRERKAILTPIVVLKDNMKNSTQIYDNGKFEVSKLKSDMGEVQNKKMFVLDKQYNGFEILSKYQMNNYLRSGVLNDHSIIRQIKEDSLINHKVLIPKSFNKMLTNITNVNSNEKINYPSTYGYDWCFPFKEVKKSIKICPEAISVQFFKELDNISDLMDELKLILCEFRNKCECLNGLSNPNINNNLTNNFEELILPIINMINYPKLTFNDFDKGSLILESKCDKIESQNFIKHELLNKIEQGIYQVNISKIKSRFEEDKNNLLNKTMLPYFESAEGTAAYIIHQVIDKMHQLKEKRKDENELELLLSTPLNQINSQELERIKNLYIKLNKDTKAEDSNSYPFEKLLEAGKKLEKYFTNMNEVLKFHEEIHSDKYQFCP